MSCLADMENRSFYNEILTEHNVRPEFKHDLPDADIVLDNKAAVFPAAGGFVGVTLIYAGANTGDGPGWWVVLFAAGLGLITWLGLVKYCRIA